MAPPNPSMAASIERPVILRRRPDLVVSEQRYEGRTYYLIKDPVGLKYYRFQEEEYKILASLDGVRSLKEIKDDFEAEFIPQKITLEELQQFIGRLHESGMVISEAAGQGAKLLKRREDRAKKQLKSTLSNVLYIKLPGFDPARALNWLYPRFEWIYTPWALACVVLLALSALTLVLVNFHEFRGRPEMESFHSFFNMKNIVWLWIAMGMTKIVHEFGHGLTCHHFGGECHEMGMLFLVLSPALYCNVSDSWTMPNKWHRIAISLAGIYVEVVLASISTFIWWYSAPGLIHNIAFSTMFVCSVNTILLNANPLMRFDGYYVMSDWLEIPNLRTKANQLLQRTAAQVCLGLEMPADPFMPKARKGWFITYAIASWCYRWMVTFGILLFLYTFLKPYKLGAISAMMATGIVIMMFVMPVVKMVKFIFTPGRLEMIKKFRATVSGVVAVALLVGFLMIPVPKRVNTVFTVRPRDAEAVFVKGGGRIKKVLVQPGDQVKKGDVLVELENEDFNFELRAQERIATDQKYAEVVYRNLGSKFGGERAQSEELHRDALKQVEIRQEQIDDLHVTAPVDGTVFPPEIVSEPPHHDIYETLPRWHGSPLDKRNLGTFLEPGTSVCTIGDPHQKEAILIIDQSEIEFVQEGFPVYIKFDAFPDKTFQCKIEQLSRRVMEDSPSQLSNSLGGELATTQDSSGRMKPLNTSYQALVFIQDPEGHFPMDLLVSGLKGRAKIECQRRTLAQVAWRYLAETFHFRL
ncbi:HlyD family secretion protein [Symmachiella macrocystis]|uniref:HlyD family secretion protein n=1 Tax=Symmachiella macrocystis TaxID=2527985 RepID=A0A5C6BMZ9_9PLAN|nr:HlyD family efflux transporter periplasmic adaptor subunit [Symmachiella macrocystis]TWU13530.1 HlyD family secretion protein [Symmachiella macrocystis]